MSTWVKKSTNSFVMFKDLLSGKVLLQDIVYRIIQDHEDLLMTMC